MKHASFFFIVFFFAVTSVSAQFSIRPQVGVNFASFNYESIHGSVKGKSGLHFGVDFQIGKPFYVQPGVFFSTSKLEIKDFGEIKISRLDVPLMVGYKLFEKENSAFGLRIFAGPNFAFNVKETIDEEFMDISKDDFKDFHVSGIAGAGLDISIVFIDFGYKFGLTKYVESDKADANVNYFIGNVGVRLGF